MTHASCPVETKGVGQLMVRDTIALMIFIQYNESLLPLWRGVCEDKFSENMIVSGYWGHCIKSVRSEMYSAGSNGCQGTFWPVLSSPLH